MTSSYRRVAAVVIAVCLVAPLLGVSAAGAQGASGGGATVQDISVRDQLIADQESLLNVYRCLYQVDFGAVPGGCSGSEPAQGRTQPGAFEGTPTEADISVRDQLIADQESLLNIYRCQYNVDTQLVPGGCADQSEPAETTQRPASTTAAIVYGGESFCALGLDGTVVCSDGLEGPNGQFTIIKFVGGDWCGLRADQTISCWNWSSDWSEEEKSHVAAVVEQDVPSGQYTDISGRGIARGNSIKCGLRVDQTIFCWQWVRQTLRELDVPSGQYTKSPGGRYMSTAGHGSTQEDGSFVFFYDNPHSVWCGLRVDQTVSCWEFEMVYVPSTSITDDSYTSIGSLVELDGPTEQYTDIDIGAEVPPFLWRHRL